MDCWENDHELSAWIPTENLNFESLTTAAFSDLLPHIETETEQAVNSLFLYDSLALSNSQPPLSPPSSPPHQLSSSSRPPNTGQQENRSPVQPSTGYEEHRLPSMDHQENRPPVQPSTNNQENRPPSTTHQEPRLPSMDHQENRPPVQPRRAPETQISRLKYTNIQFSCSNPEKCVGCIKFNEQELNNQPSTAPPLKYSSGFFERNDQKQFAILCGQTIVFHAKLHDKRPIRSEGAEQGYKSYKLSGLFSLESPNKTSGGYILVPNGDFVNKVDRLFQLAHLIQPPPPPPLQTTTSNVVRTPMQTRRLEENNATLAELQLATQIASPIISVPAIRRVQQLDSIVQDSTTAQPLWLRDSFAPYSPSKLPASPVIPGIEEDSRQTFDNDDDDDEEENAGYDSSASLNSPAQSSRPNTNNNPPLRIHNLVHLVHLPYWAPSVSAVGPIIYSRYPAKWGELLQEARKTLNSEAAICSWKALEASAEEKALPESGEPQRTIISLIDLLDFESKVASFEHQWQIWTKNLTEIFTFKIKEKRGAAYDTVTKITPTNFKATKDRTILDTPIKRIYMFEPPTTTTTFTCTGFAKQGPNPEELIRKDSCVENFYTHLRQSSDDEDWRTRRMIRVRDLTTTTTTMDSTEQAKVLDTLKMTIDLDVYELMRNRVNLMIYSDVLDEAQCPEVEEGTLSYGEVARVRDSVLHLSSRNSPFTFRQYPLFLGVIPIEYAEVAKHFARLLGNATTEPQMAHTYLGQLELLLCSYWYLESTDLVAFRAQMNKYEYEEQLLNKEKDGVVSAQSKKRKRLKALIVYLLRVFAETVHNLGSQASEELLWAASTLMDSVLVNDDTTLTDMFAFQLKTHYSVLMSVVNDENVAYQWHQIMLSLKLQHYLCPHTLRAVWMLQAYQGPHISIRWVLKADQDKYSELPLVSLTPALDAEAVKSLIRPFIAVETLEPSCVQVVRELMMFLIHHLKEVAMEWTLINKNIDNLSMAQYLVVCADWSSKSMPQTHFCGIPSNYEEITTWMANTLRTAITLECQSVDVSELGIACAQDTITQCSVSARRVRHMNLLFFAFQWHFWLAAKEVLLNADEECWSAKEVSDILKERLMRYIKIVMMKKVCTYRVKEAQLERQEQEIRQKRIEKLRLKRVYTPQVAEYSLSSGRNDDEWGEASNSDWRWSSEDEELEESSVTEKKGKRKWKKPSSSSSSSNQQKSGKDVQPKDASTERQELPTRCAVGVQRHLLLNRKTTTVVEAATAGPATRTKKAASVRKCSAKQPSFESLPNKRVKLGKNVTSRIGADVNDAEALADKYLKSDEFQILEEYPAFTKQQCMLCGSNRSTKDRLVVTYNDQSKAWKANPNTIKKCGKPNHSPATIINCCEHCLAALKQMVTDAEKQETDSKAKQHARQREAERIKRTLYVRIHEKGPTPLLFTGTRNCTVRTPISNSEYSAAIAKQKKKRVHCVRSFIPESVVSKRG